MIGPDLPEIPLPLKNIQQYLKIASQHDQRDPVVGYWCRVYAFQTGFKLSTKTSKETNFLMELMDWLEKTKKKLHDNEAITNDVAAQAHLENWALKLFLYADKNDRAANFEKNVVKSFFTAGLLYDVLTVFGELTEEAIQNRKYAKWKAAYIHNCLKNGETPIPGPMQEGNENDDLNKNMEEDSLITEAKEDDTSNADELVGTRNTNPPDAVHGTTIKDNIDKWSSGNKDCKTLMETEGGVELSVEQIGKAQKFIKWAGSALNYDDVPTTVLNLRKALHLLTTGQELE
ncbi:vacuolar protein sorting-associated protein VTA1 homolog [Bombus impatiens]|uniref:Vacuolar protein sorting-associated protein VTA1 homolog n=1 Tax=Bombus impatiens TaxID=132113 RepID=A0A6P3UPA2_BOMIM|nr:vacuolar protein sorting-associated protein VTA1 homolog [Bombus impatiens]XP_012237974.1 vacuolar protein sorting-associated protein VTA1 homolog [Bombus impatiens]XP_012237976.1 vacuolar protein sorting-associated protein VTA1 homolog [Bombus impatiens]XP_033175395.1 vacuolar protein sorting-associated protein VTA1 homolog [Bombus impatiens]